MRALTTAVFATVAMGTALLGAAPVQAQEYPWCLQYGGGDDGGGANCGFISWDQCMVSRLGNGGFCYRNPFYRGDGPYAQQRPSRKHRHKHRHPS